MPLKHETLSNRLSLDAALARLAAHDLVDGVAMFGSRAAGPVVANSADARPAEAAWQQTPRSARFVDMVTGQPAFFDTRAAALWRDQKLYVDPE